MSHFQVGRGQACKQEFAKAAKQQQELWQRGRGSRERLFEFIYYHVMSITLTLRLRYATVAGVKRIGPRVLDPGRHFSARIISTQVR